MESIFIKKAKRKSVLNNFNLFYQPHAVLTSIKSDVISCLYNILIRYVDYVLLQTGISHKSMVKLNKCLSLVLNE